MNVADSREYRLALETLGMTCIEGEHEGDLLLVNTCSVRAKAEDKLVSYLGAAQAAAEGNPELKVGLVGCTATLIGKELMRRFPIIKFILPATEMDFFAERVARAIPGLSTNSPMIAGSACDRERFERFVTVIRGCDMFCSYCVVPYARGKVLSLPFAGIIKQCDDAAADGCKVITLLGQNVMAYGNNPVDAADTPDSFAALLGEVARRYPDQWIKFLTSHPRDVTTELIDIVAVTPNISKHCHLPEQSGDDGVLKAMNRGYTSTQYRELIADIRTKIPGNRVSTDIIVGFPTEDESAFESTLSLARELEFDQMFTFQYSPRSGTAAYDWEDTVGFKRKRERLQQLIGIQNEIVLKKHRALVGTTIPVVIYGATKRDPNMLSSVSRESHMVIIRNTGIKPGTSVEVEITKGLQRTLEGRLVG